VTWTRLDDGIFDHPKMLRAGDDAAHLYVRALVYCNRLLTDGRVHAEALPVIFRHRAVRDLAARLVAVGAWEEHPEGGWLVHDFHDLNPTADEVRAKRDDIRAKRAAAGKQGGIASGRARSNEANTKQAGSKQEANIKHTDEANTKPRPVPSRPSSETPNGVSSAASQSAAPNAAEEGDEEKPSRKPPRPDAPAPLPGTPEHAVMRALVAAPLLSERVSRPHEFCRAAAAAFAGLDVPREIARAEAWVTANPRRRPVNAGRFLHAWLAKAQDRAAATGAAQHQRASLFSPPAPVQSGTDRILDPRTKQFVTRAEYEASRGR
jgi:hypothetical protein